MESGKRRRAVSDGDRISNLSDDLLREILIKLRSSAAAARTSVLSRRWRHVWAALPELLLENVNAVGSIDAALAACAAPTVSRLAITIPLMLPNDLRTARVAPWLRFASQRLAAGGELTLRLPRQVEGGVDGDGDGEDVLTLPPHETVAAIALDVRSTLRLPRDDGCFAALTVARISGARIASGDFECFGSSRCPRLQTLELRGIKLLAGSQISIRSESLERLVFLAKIVRGLEVVAPNLQYLRAPARHIILRHAYIAAPRLADLSWYVDYNPDKHQFVGVGNHLRRLLIRKRRSMTALKQRFNVVDELVLKAGTLKGTREYNCTISAATPIPAKCDTLEVDLRGPLIVGQTWGTCHAFAPSMLHLLRKSPALRKLVVHLPLMTTVTDGKRSSCATCSSNDSYNTDNIALGLLEEVLLLDFLGADENLEFLKMLLACKAENLKIISINMLLCDCDPSIMKEKCQKIISV